MRQTHLSHRLDGVRIAASNDDLWDPSPLQAPLNISELGSVLARNVWSGSTPSGLQAIYPVGSAEQLIAGFSSQTDGSWIQAHPAMKSESYSWYAMSAPLTVPSPSPVPEPGTLTMLSIGAAMVWGWSRRRRPASVVRNPA